MPYTLEWLIQQDEAEAKLKYLPFWGHTPPKDGSISKTVFSQWWAGHPVEFEGIRYATAEHWMMAGKARLFGDDEILAKILENDSAPVAKKLGRKAIMFLSLFSYFQKCPYISQDVFKIVNWRFVVVGKV